MNTDVITTIRARQSAAAAKIAKLRPQLETLERELREYETAIKVLEQVSGATAEDSAATPSRAANEPSMPELIVQALASGPKPIADVTAAVSDMSDKPIDANNIRSTAWRMWKAGRIEKTGDDYHLVGAGPSPNVEDGFDLI